MRLTRDIPLVTCSRCGEHLEQTLVNDFTAGYYELTGYWSRFARKDETILCDACMWKDPEYIAIYGQRDL